MVCVDLHRILILVTLFLTVSASSTAPQLDFAAPPALQKLSTFTIGSPGRATSPPAVASALLSPGVGEFKGWFSNLFHWKAQSYLLYSTDDVATSRTEVRQLLQALGISVLEDRDQSPLPRCERAKLASPRAHIRTRSAVLNSFAACLVCKRY